MIMRIPPSQDYSEEAYCRGISDYMPSMTASGFSFLHRADPESLPTDLTLMTVSPTLEVQWSCPLHLESRAAANSVIATLGRSRPLQLPTDHRFMCFQSGYRFMRSHANYSSNGQNGATGRQHPQLWVQRSDIHRWVRWPTMLADSPVGLVDRLRHRERLGLFWNAGLPKRRDRIGSNSQLEQCNSKIIFVDTECSPGPNKRRRRLGNMP
jgi:hypothetical protein